MRTKSSPKVLLLTGPSGSGKTTIARRIGSNPGWSVISEDEYWVEIKRRHRDGEMRTPEEQRIIQPRALQSLFDALAQRKSVVFEFLLYEDPPKPLAFYMEELARQHILPLVKVLKPSIETILTRQGMRGREQDADVQAARFNAQRQLVCLQTEYISHNWIVDTSNESAEETYRKHFLPIL